MGQKGAVAGLRRETYATFGALEIAGQIRTPPAPYMHATSRCKGISQELAASHVFAVMYINSATPTVSVK
mgnify:CR=1 FL=1